MTQTVRVALVGGPAYDPLYECLPPEVAVGFKGTHPELNAHLAAFDDPPYDLVSTHSKYAPSQLRFLAPLSGLAIDDFFPAALELASIEGRLFGVPRNIDVRLLHYRTDLIDEPPATWDDLIGVARRVNRPPDVYGFAFPGKESGLFGTFFELVEMAGARLFLSDVNNEAGSWALNLLRSFYQEGLTPRELPDWHFDEVHRCFRDGKLAMVGEWPGYYRLLQNSVPFAVTMYPAGPSGRSLAYGGSHTFALTRHGVDNSSAVALLELLTAPEQQLGEARRGTVPVRKSVMKQVREESEGVAAERWACLQKVIHDHILIPPKLPDYPAIEEMLWRTIQAAILGRIAVRDALAQIDRRLEPRGSLSNLQRGI